MRTNRKKLSPYAQRVYSALEHENMRRVRQEDIAKKLRTSVSTMRRRLLQEGLMYSNILMQVRIVRLQNLLSRQGWVCGERAASVLGFCSRNSFYRAFRGWANMGYEEMRIRYRDNEEERGTLINAIR